MHPGCFFVPSFVKAIGENTEESLRSIMNEPSQGLYTFEMLQPHFCELLFSEVSSFLVFSFVFLFPLIILVYIFLSGSNCLGGKF